MDTAIQIVHTCLWLLLGAFSLTLIGKTHGEGNRRSGTAMIAFLNGLFTIAFMIWWDTPDMASMIAKYGLIAFMWVLWLLGLPNINKPYPVFKPWVAVAVVVFIAARIGVVLAFWH